MTSGAARAGSEPEALIEALRQMMTIRAFNQMAEQLRALGEVHGTVHLAMQRPGYGNVTYCPRNARADGVSTR